METVLAEKEFRATSNVSFAKVIADSVISRRARVEEIVREALLSHFVTKNVYYWQSGDEGEFYEVDGILSLYWQSQERD